MKKNLVHLRIHNHNAFFRSTLVRTFESPTSFKDETTTADKKHMTCENFSRNYGHNFQNVFFGGILTKTPILHL